MCGHLDWSQKKTNWKQNVLNKKNNTFIYDEHTVVVDVKALAVKTFHKSREKKRHDLLLFFLASGCGRISKDSDTDPDGHTDDESLTFFVFFWNQTDVARPPPACNGSCVFTVSAGSRACEVSADTVLYEVKGWGFQCHSFIHSFL